MSLEDGGAAAAGAGVFASFVDVPAAEVWDAIRAVWASAFTTLAATYARRRGAPVQVGVIVQRFVPGRRITVYTRPPGAPAADDAWVEPAGADAAVVGRDAGNPRVALAVAAERAIAAAAGADVELVDGPDGLAVVQARPIVHPAPRPRRPPPPAPLLATTRATPGVTWRWDAAHNPAPLSEAQAALVERVDAAGAAPHRMRVIAGHLYYADGPAPGEPAPDEPAGGPRRRAPPPS